MTARTILRGQWVPTWVLLVACLGMVLAWCLRWGVL
jgi:hypothetical protein